MDVRFTTPLVWLMVIGPALGQEQSSNKTFGERQIEQMLDDRPDMKNVISCDDPVYTWVVTAFEGGATRNRVYWNATNPFKGFPACSYPAYGFYPPQICIVEDAHVSNGIDKWFSVVFEHFNLDNEAEQLKLRTRMFRGEITFEEFADSCVKLERIAEKKTVAFLESRLPDTHPLRNCSSMLTSEFAKNRRPNAKWDYSPNRAHFIDYCKSLTLPQASLQEPLLSTIKRTVERLSE